MRASTQWSRWIGAVAMCSIAGVLAACGSGGGSSAGADDATAIRKELGGPLTVGTPRAGGTLRVGQTQLLMTDGFDPTGEYSQFVTQRVMLRTLLAYPGTAGVAGTKLVPDLAEALPTVSDDGRTYTFTLREGVRFGPPVDRAITSRDIRYAFERIATPGLAQYANYYTSIRGFPEAMAGRASTIAGISTPDDRTVVFTLTAPRGDFPHALTLPATAPIPEEVARCHTDPGAYGRYVVASGPYMLEGSEKLDISSCASQKPISGYDPLGGLTLVRNPSYDPATSEAGTRPDYADRIEVSVDSNPNDLFAKIARGELDTAIEKPPSGVVRDLLADPATRPRLRVNSGDTVWALLMNLTRPPFDDVHVRRALNLVMDLRGLQRAWGGPVQGEIATDIVSDTVLEDRLPTSSYRPFQKPPFAGDLEAAKAEMRLSRYDGDKDGVCDAAVCRGILLINRNEPVSKASDPIIRASAARIGLGLTVRELPANASFAAVTTPSKPYGIAANLGFGKDYADPSSFFTIGLDGRSIVPQGNFNTSLVGITPAVAAKVGVTLPAGAPVPSIDTDIDACLALAGTPRLDCWEQLDRKVTEEVVPGVPFLDSTRLRVAGPSVTAFDFDQGFAEIALDRIAVDPARQR